METRGPWDTLAERDGTERGTPKEANANEASCEKNILEITGNKRIRVRPERCFLDLFDSRAIKEGPGSAEGSSIVGTDRTRLQDIVSK